MNAPDPRKPARRTGLAHLLAAAAYSAAGLRRLWRESAFRQEAALAVLLLAAFALLGVPLARWIALLVLLLALVAVEAINTALEIVVDHVSPEWSEFARDAKDLGSLAVALMLAAIVAYSAWAMAAR